MLLSLTVATALGATLAGSTPPPPDAPPLTLKQALALTWANSPLRMGPAAMAEGMAEAARMAGRPLNPVIEFRTENWRPGASTVLPLDVWAVISQPIELAGKRGIRRAIAAADRDAASASLSLVDRQLVLRVTTLYFQALRSRAVLSTLSVARDGLGALVNTMHERVDEGYVAEGDLLRFEAEAARLDIDIVRAQLDLTRSLDALTTTLGLPTRIAAAQLLVPASIAAPARIDASITTAVERHPELVAASARITRAEQTLAFERARRLSDPTITTGFKQTMGVGTVVAAVTAAVPLFIATMPRGRQRSASFAPQRPIAMRRGHDSHLKSSR